MLEKFLSSYFFGRLMQTISPWTKIYVEKKKQFWNDCLFNWCSGLNGWWYIWWRVKTLSAICYEHWKGIWFVAFAGIYSHIEEEYISISFFSEYKHTRKKISDLQPHSFLIIIYKFSFKISTRQFSKQQLFLCFLNQWTLLFLMAKSKKCSSIKLFRSL